MGPLSLIVLMISAIIQGLKKSTQRGTEKGYLTLPQGAVVGIAKEVIF